MNYFICFGIGVMVGGLFVTYTKTKAERDTVKK
jgi:hypothetical protein